MTFELHAGKGVVNVECFSTGLKKIGDGVQEVIYVSNRQILQN